MKNNPFTQLCVWPSTSLGDATPDDLVKFFKDDMNTRIKYHTEVETRPDIDSNGDAIPDTGGRLDLFFYVHTDDILAFAIPRMQMGIKWWEDMVGYNDNTHLYTPEFIKENPLTW
jgi:hypothetical protein